MTRHRLCALLTLAAVIGATAAPACAASLEDYDGDGKVSRTEYREAITAIANAADANKDGMIDASEFAYTPADLALFDNNADGKISAVGVQEFIDGMDVAFDAMDTDLDGYLGVLEIEAAKARYGIAAPGLKRGNQAASENPRPFSKG
jgi:hypothetical protein